MGCNHETMESVAGAHENRIEWYIQMNFYLTMFFFTIEYWFIHKIGFNHDKIVFRFS